MDRFVKIRDELITASNHEGAKIPIDSSLLFKNKATKCAKMLDDVKFTAVSLQKRLLTLKECRNLLYMLISEAETGKNNWEFTWYKINLVRDIFILTQRSFLIRTSILALLRFKIRMSRI